MAKFELAELRKVHEEMAVALSKMNQKNKNTVEPVLNGLKQNVRYKYITTYQHDF